MRTKEQVVIAKQNFRLLSLLAQQADFTDKEAAEVSAYYPVWEKGKSYGNNTRLRYGTDTDGKPLLWVTTRNVGTSDAPPDVTPGSYRLLG